MLLLQPLYGWLTRASALGVSAWVTVSSPPTLLIFWVWFRLQAEHIWIARAYFVWVERVQSVVVAAFWSLMATCSA